MRRVSVSPAVRALFCLLVLAIATPALDFSYSAVITGSSPRWSRPVDPTPLDPNDVTPPTTIASGGTGGNVGYHVFSFVPTITGLYTIVSNAVAPNWDNYIVLYRNTFNPAAPLVNAIGANDDYPVFGNVIGISRLNNVALNAGTTYFLVTTGYSNGSQGTASNSITQVVPEPGTYALVGAALIAIGLARRRSR